MDKDKEILRDLAKQYMDVCAKPVMDERRKLWSRKNSLKPVRPLVYVRAFAWKEMPGNKRECQDPLFRWQEGFLRKQLFLDTIDDDSILEPWLTLNATHRSYGWGVEGEKVRSDEDHGEGAYKEEYPLKDLSDLAKLHVPRHDIDEDATTKALARLEDAVGDIIPINLDRGPAHGTWGADLSTDLGHLRGIEHVMLDMLDDPEGLHKLLAFMRDGVLKDQGETEAAGDWGLSNHYNQAMPYAEELEAPAANTRGVGRDQLWCFMAAQELTAVSPAMHDEFMLQYQLPILKKFGLVAYGCCEDLTRKIDMLRQIPNLRRIAVSPFADVAKCAEQIGEDYVVSYRPSPADMVSYGFDENRIRTTIKNDLEACKGCHVDITLKDVETVESDPERIAKWVQIVRSVVEQQA